MTGAIRRWRNDRWRLRNGSYIAKGAWVASALILTSCAGGGPTHQEASSAASPGHPYALRGSAEEPATTTTTTAPPPPTTHAPRARASRQHVAPRPAPHAGTAAPAAGDLLDALARCESGGNPRAIGGGGRFFGAFQFVLRTWHSLGGSGNPVDHSYAEQKAIAAKISVSSWRSQFPHCARVLGVA